MQLSAALVANQSRRHYSVKSDGFCSEVAVVIFGKQRPIWCKSVPYGVPKEWSHVEER